ncbi:MAG: GspE/PulE family protein [Fibrobacter sp.]|nr:GspE/PulE family protein [Fibrobacter sp.]
MQKTVYSKQEQHDSVLRVAISNIHDELVLEKLRVESGCRVEPEYRPETEIRQIIRARSLNESQSLLEALTSPIENLSTKNTWEAEPVINLVDSLIDTALRQKATDIHLEPNGQELRVRFRKDGLLTHYRSLPAWLSEPVLIRLKLLANVDITERRLPHDGSFCFDGACGKANVRLSTIPIQTGEEPTEKCVLRLLPATDNGATLASLGFGEPLLRALRRTFESPQGLFLITGPTGSGKTTTLYAGLREIIGRKINVTTIEDPVEYKLEGANQVQVNEKCGFTFAAALRSILRQDPDVILVGEIRDTETAQIALRAAQTGHLVLATLHTNSARAATARLADLGVSPALLQDSLLGVVAQRLVRKRPPTGNAASSSAGDTAGGRTAIAEFLNPDGSYVDGSLLEQASRLVAEGVIEIAEVTRVLGCIN